MTGPVFELAVPGRILFGRGASAQAAERLREYGRRLLVVVGGATDRHTARLQELRHAGLAIEVLNVSCEPTVDLIRGGVQLARGSRTEVVLGMGGGSALDAAKAIAILTTHPGEVLDYLEVVGAGKMIDRPGLPMVAVPTTAGTGTEVTRNSVLASPEHGVKVSLRSPFLVPRLAIVDPDLSSDMPPALTARVGLDALTQLIEPFVSTRANPLTDAVCREGLRLASQALPRAFRDGSDLEARGSMAAAAMLSGMALANAGLGVIHGLAGPIGGMVPAPHGSVCAALLAPGMEVNLRALRGRMPEAEALRRYAELGPLLTGDSRADAGAAVAWVAGLVRDLHIPPLAAFGLTSDMIPTVVERATVASSSRTNPVSLSHEEFAEIVRRAI